MTLSLPDPYVGADHDPPFHQLEGKELRRVAGARLDALQRNIEEIAAQFPLAGANLPTNKGLKLWVPASDSEIASGQFGNTIGEFGDSSGNVVSLELETDTTSDEWWLVHHQTIVEGVSHPPGNARFDSRLEVDTADLEGATAGPVHILSWHNAQGWRTCNNEFLAHLAAGTTYTFTTWFQLSNASVNHIYWTGSNYHKMWAFRVG